MNKESNIFTHLSDIAVKEPINQVFGTAQAEIGNIEAISGAKTARKTGQILSVFQKYELIPPELNIGSLALQYKTSGVGDPGYTFIKLEDEKGKGWYVHPRVLAVKKEGIIADAHMVLSGVNPHNIQIVSGTCLFGATGVDAQTADGEIYHITDISDMDRLTKPIVDLSVSPFLHHYEAETILRLTNFFQILSKEKQQMTLNFHIPEIEYMGYGWDLHQKGLMSTDLLMKWFGEVNKRAGAMKTLYQKRMPETFSLVPISPLKSIKSMIIKYLDMPKEQAMQMVAGQLSSSSFVWNFLISQFGIPHDPVKLSKLSYQAAYLQTANKCGLTMVIENPNEVRIWENMKENLRNGINAWFAGGGNALKYSGLYIHPDSNIPEGGGLHGASYMLYSSVKPGLKPVKEIIKTHKNNAPERSK